MAVAMIFAIVYTQNKPPSSLCVYACFKEALSIATTRSSSHSLLPLFQLDGYYSRKRKEHPKITFVTFAGLGLSNPPAAL